MSLDNTAKNAVSAEFLSQAANTVVLFKNPESVPKTRRGALVFAPGYEGSLMFDPALDFLVSAPSLQEGAKNFSESLVTDEDILSSRDPIWSYNSRSLLESLFICGTELWKYLHEDAASRPGRIPPDFPSLTDTIFGMFDDLAAAKTGADGEKDKNSPRSLPEWWNIVPDGERQVLRTVVLGAPQTTAGSLLAVVNSYTSGISRTYSAGKCPALFSPDVEENVYVYLPAVNASMLGVVLKAATAAWGANTHIVAREVSSWNKRILDVFAEFLLSANLRDENVLATASTPPRDMASWWSGPVAWGTSPSYPSLGLFRAKVEETTGNVNGRLVVLETETPEHCSVSSYIRLDENGWSEGFISERAIDSVEGVSCIKIMPSGGEQSKEIRDLRRIFSDGERSPMFSVGDDGTHFVVFERLDGEDEFIEEEPEETAETNAKNEDGMDEPDVDNFIDFLDFLSNEDEQNLR